MMLNLEHGQQYKIKNNNMGSLSNLYISQSYQSLIHLGSDTSISSSYTDLQDGLGNTLKISVNAQGDISASGNVYAANLGSITFDTGSLLTTASFNNGTRNLTFTKGNNSTFAVNIPDASGSVLPAGTISGSSQITALGFVSSSVTASSLTTASLSGNTLTFTKGNGTTFGIVIPDVSGSDISSLNAFTASIAGTNAFTQSANIRLNNLEAATSSYAISSSVAGVDAAQQVQINSLISATGSYANSASFAASQLVQDNRLNSLESTSASVNVSVSALNGFTASVAGTNNFTASIAGTNAFTQSAAVSIAALNSETSSYARLNVNNQFTTNQTITGSLVVTGTITANELHVIIESSSVIFSSGSNILGDELSDTQILSGSVKIVGTADLNGSPLITSAQTASYIQDLGPLNAFSASTNTFTASIAGTNAFTASIAGTNTFTASIAGTNTFTQSADQRLDSIEAQSGSWVTSAITASSLVTASFDNGTRNLTFTKGDASTFSVNIPDVSGSQGTFVTTSSFNAYTSSNDQRVSSLETNSGSVNTSITNINTATASLFTSASNALITASLSGQTLTFTKGNNSTFAVTIPDVSGSDISALNQATASLQAFTASIAGTNAFTQSANSRLTALENTSASLNNFTSSQLQINSGYNTFTQSIQAEVDSLQAATSSYADSASFAASQLAQDIRIDGLSAQTSSYAISSSVAAVDAAQQTQINNLTSATSSFVTESETGSFARTNVDNNFSVNQTFTNITAVSASFTYVQTTYETSSVIYSSGSNQFGDELTDTQILSGSVKVVGGLTLNGVNVITSADTASYINTALNAFSASTNLFTASIAGTNAFTQSANGRLNSLEAATASFATTGSNIFRGDEIFSGNIEVRDNIFAGYVDMRDDGGLFLRATGSHYTPGIGEFWSIASQFQIGDLVFVQQPSNDKVISLGLDNRYLSIYKGIKSAGGADFGWDVGQYPLTISSSFGGATDLFNVLGNISASNLHLTGGLTASLQQGYVWVGDSNNKTVLVPTSSFATDISALNTFTASIADTNAFTASATLRLNSLETTSASVNTSIASLNSATSSYAISASVAAVDLAQQNQINVLIAATGSYATTSSLNAYTQSNDARVNSLEAKTGSYATTGSNAFIGNQTITGVLSISSSAAFDLDITGGFKATAASQISGSQATLSLSQLSVQVSGSLGNNVMGRGYYDASINTNKIAIYASGSSTLGGFTAAPLGTCGIAIQSGSVLTNYYYPIQFQGSTQYTDGRVTIATPLSASAGLTIQSGSAFFANGNRQFNIGAFSSLVSQSGSANVSQSMNFETTDISSGVSIASNSRITLANSGTYNIQFSAQLLADTGADDVYIWLKKNGTNVAASAGHVALANNEELIAAWNYVVDAVANDYYELAWQSANGDAILLTEVASGNIPSIPSVILTVTQVR